mmetsp:Transcript_91188/g.158073  ORF Transcript_91188/g.158073 Transcript_91188/m.158073 type:complete len:463 (+) Transcript_91188:2767-4155(+)
MIEEPRTPFDRDAILQERQHITGPISLERDLEQCSAQTPGTLADKVGVGDQRETVDLGLRYEPLQQYIDLLAPILSPSCDDRNDALLFHLLQLMDLIIARLEVIEFMAFSKKGHRLLVDHCLGQLFIEELNGLILDVQMGGDASQLGVLHQPRVFVKADHHVLIECLSCRAHQLLSLAPKQRVICQGLPRHSVVQWVGSHADIQISIPKPPNSLADVRHSPQDNFRVQMVCKRLSESGLDWSGVGQQTNVLLHFVMGCDDDTLTAVLVLRTPCTPKYLLHVQDPQVHEASLVGVVHVCSFDDNGVGGKVDAPCECRGTHQDPNLSCTEQLLTEHPVSPQHPCVVAAKPTLEDLFQLAVLALVQGLAGPCLHLRGLEQLKVATLAGQLHQHLCGLHGCLSAVDKDHDLVVLPEADQALVEAGLSVCPFLLVPARLLDTNEKLAQGHRTVRLIEHKHPTLVVHP